MDTNKKNMFDTKFICTLVALVIAAIAICNFERTAEIRENFLLGAGVMREGKTLATNSTGQRQATNITPLQAVENLTNASDTLTQAAMQEGVSRAAVTQEILKTAAPAVAANQENFVGPHPNRHMKEPFGFQVPPNYQKMLAPRGCGNAEGFQNPNVQYNPPATRHMAYDNMEKYTNMVKEGYQGNCGGPGETCAGGTSADYVSPTFGVPQAGFNSLAQNSGLSQFDLIQQQAGTETVMALPGAALPLQEMTDVSGEKVVLGTRPVVGLKSRNMAHGDPIRGDLAIVGCNQGWFSTSQSSNPASNLRVSALSVMGGTPIQTGDGTTTASGFDNVHNFTKTAQLNSMVGQDFSQGTILNPIQQAQLGSLPDTVLSVANA